MAQRNGDIFNFKEKMNILISTTTNWNPGDDFLRIGVKNILKYIYPITNYIHYDRNPNNMIDYPNNQNIKAGLRGNFMNNPIDWEMIDLVVLAGSPEFLHHPLAPIYEGLVEHPEIPLFAIGVGYSYPEFILPLTESELTVLKRENTLIIARQQELSDRLKKVLNRQIHTLPCPALFCFEEYPEKTKEDNYKNTSCHSLSELSDSTFFSSDAYDMLHFIGKHKRFVSTRLHGVIAAISAGANASLIADDFRTKEGIKLFEEVLESDRSGITPFKTRILNNYINIIQQYANTLTTK